MKNFINIFIVLITISTYSQSVNFEKYTLENGLDVILHQDNSAPIVVTSMMYHVGAKDEDEDKTGFAHFFEHLLFEGTKNIDGGYGGWNQIINSNGGTFNANTTADRTYYYEIFPSNKLEIGLWLESERMLHPVVSQKGINTQNEVVKEEKRRAENQPYGKLIEVVSENLFEVHPYKGTVIGKMEHLDAATEEDYKKFNKKFHVPNNAVLVVAGDIEVDKTLELVKKYFGEIPKGKEVERSFPKEKPITENKRVKSYDKNIQIPAYVLAYRTPPQNDRDSWVLNMISTYLSDGESSKLYKKIVDEKKMALAVQAINLSQEDYGIYIVFNIPMGEKTFDEMNKEIDEEIYKIQNELISERDFEKIRNKIESQFVSSNSSFEGIASSLATYHMLYDDVNLINDQIDIYMSITREEMRDVANKYLNTNQRIEVEYLPNEK
jgi:predicted Zn-dependent peptidase